MNTILGNRYRASTQLRDKRFENCLDDEPQGGPPICQSLLQRVYWEKCQSPELRAFFGFDLGSPTSTFISIFNPLVSSLKFLKTKLAEMGFDYGPLNLAAWIKSAREKIRQMLKGPVLIFLGL